MELVYKITLVVHLLCAMLFIGWGFAKLFVITPMREVLSCETYASVQGALSKKVWKIYPANMMVLILTGSFLFTKYVSFSEGLFPSIFQTMLIIKAILAYGIGTKVVYSITKRLLSKDKNGQSSCGCSQAKTNPEDPNPVQSSAYYYIFSAGVVIVLLAKLMFLV